MKRMDTSTLALKVLDSDAAEILTIRCEAKELPRVMEIFNILNNTGRFSIDKIYSYGRVETTKVITKQCLEYRGEGGTDYDNL